VRRLPGDEDAIFVLPVSAELVPDGDLACDWRDGDVW
jgi:aminoglycoside 2'-N-acetyltransferase I